MGKYENVECRRCGNTWYSEKFSSDKKLPEACPRCYQEEIREIPAPPTRIEIAAEKIKTKKNKLPDQIQQKRHDAVIWKENNRFIISLIEVGSVLLTVIFIIVYVLFF